jgi:hypothetical protein
MSKSSIPGLTGFCGLRRKGGQGAARLKSKAMTQEALDEKVLGRPYGEYPWDDWKETAVKEGAPEDLAGLGRAVMREAFEHGWDERLKSLCGWADGGKRMIALALRSPQRAKKRWERLLDTDGNRGHYDERTGEWVSRI